MFDRSTLRGFPLRLIALVMTAMLLTACAMPPDSARLTPAVAPLPAQSGEVYHAATATMKRMIARAVAEQHWAVASLTDQVTALAFEVWTPADQQVLIRSRQLDTERSRVQVRVGRFGNPEAERAFHAELARQLELWRADPLQAR